MQPRCNAANWQRLADYERRAALEPPTTLRRAVVSSDYVAVHPFGDDRRTLQGLRVGPSQCKAVDLYWRIGDDVVFVQVEAVAPASSGPRGAFVRWNNWSPPTLVLRLVMEAPFVRRRAVEEMLRSLLPGLRRNMVVLASVGRRQVPLAGIPGPNKAARS